MKQKAARDVNRDLNVSRVISQCQCFGIQLTLEQKVYIEQCYNDCLCRDCLQYLQQELNLFKEKYFFK